LADKCVNSILNYKIITNVADFSPYIILLIILLNINVFILLKNQEANIDYSNYTFIGVTKWSTNKLP